MSIARTQNSSQRSSTEASVPGTTMRQERPSSVENHFFCSASVPEQRTPIWASQTFTMAPELAAFLHRTHNSLTPVTIFAKLGHDASTAFNLPPQFKIFSGLGARQYSQNLRVQAFRSHEYPGCFLPPTSQGQARMSTLTTPQIQNPKPETL